MAGDRLNQNTPGRPLMPLLASNRAPKAPLTPKLAVKANLSSNSGGVSPVARQNGVATRAGAREDPSTPMSSLSNNITPRSSARRSRVDSPQSTPGSEVGGTPTSVRGKSPSHGRTPGPSGLGITDSPRLIAARPKSQVSGLRMAPVASGTGVGIQVTRGAARPVSEYLDKDNSPNFFRANEAKEAAPAPRFPEPKKAATFVYANGEEDDERGRLDVPSPAMSADDKSITSKFFHADGTAEHPQAFPMLSPPISASSSKSSFVSSPTQAVPPLLPVSQQSHPRSSSPPKERIHLSYRKGASQVIPAGAQRHPTTSTSASTTPNLASQSHFDPQETPRRRSSAAASSYVKPRSHTKTASMSSLDITPRRASIGIQNTSSPISSPTPLHTSSPLSIAEEQTPNHKLLSQPISPTSNTWPRSPTKSTNEPFQDSQDSTITPNPTLNHLNELAAKARHERKVLDLEISNASLLTVNRSLEREIRKQKAELRRYRRMTRSSMRGISMGMSRATSYGSGVDVGGVNEDGLEEGMEELGFDEEDFDSEEEEDDITSESGSEEGMMGRKEKDAKRLRLDLSKHRELLVDSQKLNQSIKRCVGFTEELISEGKRALEFRVRVSDVKLGGRVLSDDEDEDDGSPKEVDIHEEMGDEAGFHGHGHDQPADGVDLNATNGFGGIHQLTSLLEGAGRRTVSFGSALSNDSSSLAEAGV
ncbi:MAG: hypothetical protein M1820_003763 [Bogoriella megaspora]|nr:MAG: hypothetical protein M1820_003763 [Bogoriella megaspora]